MVRFRVPHLAVSQPKAKAVPAEVERDRNAIGQHVACPMLAGRWITVDDGLGETELITFTAMTARKLVHALGRPVIGYQTYAQDAIEPRTYPTASDNSTITIYPITSCVCRVWVF